MLASNAGMALNNTHNWNRDYGEQARRKTRKLMRILRRTSVYANASMNDAKCSNPDSDTVVTSGWSANESLEFDPRPIDTDEQSSNSSLKAANTEAPCRSVFSSRHSYPFLRSKCGSHVQLYDSRPKHHLEYVHLRYASGESQHSKPRSTDAEYE